MTCTRCGKQKEVGNTNAKLRYQCSSTNDIFICKECQEIGFSNKSHLGLNEYQCAGGHVCGYKAFDKDVLYNFLRNRIGSHRLICQTCKHRPSSKCSVLKCMQRKIQQYEWEFDSNELKLAL